MTGLSNCHIKAWQYLRQGKARYLCIRFTEYSRLAWIAQQWWWTPIRWTGIALQWCVWPLVHLGEMLRSGRWYHATWIVSPGRQHYEYVSHWPKRKQIVPPVLFAGREREVEDD